VVTGIIPRPYRAHADVAPRPAATVRAAGWARSTPFWRRRKDTGYRERT